jgi:hypothetical protein
MATHLDYDTDKRIIYVTTAPTGGTLTLDVRGDIYNDVKDDWRTVAALKQHYFPFFQPVGGDTIIPGSKYLGNYLFLKYGWRMRPYEESHTLYLTNGFLLVDGGGDPWLETLGGYTVNIRDAVPSDAFTLETGVSGLTSAESSQLLALGTPAQNAAANLAALVETGFSVQDALKLMSAVLAGKATGGGTTQVTFRNVNDDTNAVVMTVDTDGNRSLVTLNL